VEGNISSKQTNQNRGKGGGLTNPLNPSKYNKKRKKGVGRKGEGMNEKTLLGVSSEKKKKNVGEKQGRGGCCNYVKTQSLFRK